MRLKATHIPISVLLLAVLLVSVRCSLFRKPNVILITLDTTRADHIGCYGSSVASTPVLDALADESILFETAMSDVPITLPSHSSIMTGLTALGHRVHNNGSFRLDPAFETLAEYMAFADYSTGAFVSAVVLDGQFGLDQGFEIYDDTMTNERAAPATTERAIAWLDAHADQPFFLWVHYFDPHTPWEAPEPFASSTRGTGYDAEISAMDASLGDLLAALKARGLYDKSHVIVIGDHGEGLHDHGEAEHGVFLYDESLHVPFLWKRPGESESRRVQALVGTIDVLPTLLEMLDEPIVEETEGRSLLPLISGDSIDRTGLYAETLYPYYAYEWSPLHAWRTDAWKYIDAPTPELYDMTADPGETRNVIAEHEDVAATLSRRLGVYRRQIAKTMGIPAEGAVQAGLQEQLRSLGYISSGGGSTTATPDSLADPKDFVDLLEHFEAGKHAIDDQDWTRARDEFGAVVERLPDAPIATLGMGLAEVGLGNGEAALPWLRRTIEKQPDNPFATFAMGQAFLEEGRAADAVTWFERFLAMKPGDPNTLESLGDAFLALGEPENALDAYEGAAVTSPSILRKTAETQLRLGRFEEAAATYSEGARRSVPEQRALWSDRADLARRVAPFGMSAPAPSPEDFHAQALAVAALGLEDEARRLLAAGQDLHGPRVAATVDGDMAMQAGDWQAARAAYARAESLGTRSADVYQNHFIACVQLGEMDEAEELLTRGARVTGDTGGVLHYNLACILARQSRHDEAMRALEVAVARGYTDRGNLETDPDLDALRDRPEFRRLLSDVPR